jgi:replicative DNA helicase
VEIIAYCVEKGLVIGEETSAGKSALAQSLIEDIVFINDSRAVWYSLEMSERDLAYRLTASRGSIDGKRIFNPRNHGLRQQDTQALTKAVAELGEADIVLRSSSDITAEQIRAEVRDYAADGNLGLVVVDYLQLIDAYGDRNTTQEQILHRISKTLLSICKELDVAVIALTQLNDQGRIRSCRAIGQDAEVYLTIEEDGLFVAKNRNGERNITLPITLDKPHFRFAEPSDRAF